MAWWKAPDEGQEIAGALTDLALALERQLEGLALVGLVDDPNDLAAKAVPLLAHRLAAGALFLQIGSGKIRLTLRNLAGPPLPPSPPSFAEVAAQVEKTDGVRFRELFARLPARAPDGDAALVEVWRLVAAEREKGAAAGPDMERG